MSDQFERVVQLFGTVDAYGVTHIATDDGNLEDRNLAFLEREMATHPTTDDERELITLLKAMSVDDRYEAWEAANPDG